MLTWAIIGLGNPGSQYCLNRHNIGFIFADVLREHVCADPFKVKGKVAWSQVDIKNNNADMARLIIVKPQTYMNLSGQGVAPVVSFYQIPPERVLVIHDDIDLAPGEVKIKQGGGHGGHNGLKSLDQTIGKNYWRLRLGVGHPGHKDAVSGYVLSNFSKNEISDWVVTLVDACVKTLPEFIFSTDAKKWLDLINNNR